MTIPMPIAQVLEFLREGNRPVVTFQGDIADLEAYAERGMRARLVAGDLLEDDTLTLTFQFEEFTEHNQMFESANYYANGRTDKSKLVTAREAGYCMPQETLYFTSSDPHTRYFTLETSETLALYGEFRASGTTLAYVQWLEAQLLSARG